MLANGLNFFRMNVASTAPDSLRECPSCLRQIDARELICPFCGFAFAVSAATRALAKDEQDAAELARWGTSRFNQKMRLVLRLSHADAEFAFDPAEIDLIVIGRRDPFNGEKPSVDLNDYDAENLGVSRRHLLIKRGESNALSLLDQGSVNGTYLNGQRLIPHQPRILRDGDEIRLGRMVINVAFKAVE